MRAFSRNWLEHSETRQLTTVDSQLALTIFGVHSHLKMIAVYLNIKKTTANKAVLAFCTEAKWDGMEISYFKPLPQVHFLGLTVKNGSCLLQELVRHMRRSTSEVNRRT